MGIISKLACLNKGMEKLNKQCGPLEDRYNLFWIHRPKNLLQRNNSFAPRPSSKLLNQSFCKMSESFLELGTFLALERGMSSWRTCSHLRTAPWRSRTRCRISSWSSVREHDSDFNKCQWQDLVVGDQRHLNTSDPSLLVKRASLAALACGCGSGGKRTNTKRREKGKHGDVLFRGRPCYVIWGILVSSFLRAFKIVLFVRWSVCLDSLSYSIWWRLYFSLGENAILISINDNSMLFFSQFANCLFSFWKMDIFFLPLLKLLQP